MLALAAGKHVYCEWPLAANLAQATKMRDLAARKGVCAMVGLQARGAPALQYAKKMLNDGYAGRVVAVRLACALPGGGGRRSADGLYVIDKVNGASTMAIQGGHAIDALRFVAGEFAGLSATIANQFDEVEVIETGERRRKDAPDQVLVTGVLASGASVSVCINGGAVAGLGIELKIFGTEGTIVISGAGAMNFQMSELRLEGARTPARQLSTLEIPPRYDAGLIAADYSGMQPYPNVDVPRATIVNVAALYQRLGAAILNGAALEPDFTTGVQMHALLDAMTQANDTGIYQTMGDKR
jgi:predicted dehydrogenase